MAIYIDVDSGVWATVCAKLSPKNKKMLKKYWSKIYPRKYVQKLVAGLQVENVQSKEAQNKDEF